MANNSELVSRISLTSGLTLAVAFAVWWSVAAQAADEKHDHEVHTGPQVSHLNHITTQAEAEALKPGDAIAMACSMCKHVMIQHVTKDDSHVKLMTIGQKHKCVCGGSVTVVGTGKGKDKHQEVNHVCTKCGDDVMFVCATKSGTGGQHDHANKK